MIKHALAVAAVVMITGGTHALAAAYPEKPIRLVVPLASGGTTDILARLIGQRFTESLGRPVIVDNRPGAGGNMATKWCHVLQPPAIRCSWQTRRWSFILA